MSTVTIDEKPDLFGPIEGPDGAAAILGYPGSRLKLQLPPRAMKLVLNFGIKAYAWRTGGAPPVTFEALVDDGRRITIWKKLLDPSRVHSDRGEQQAEIAVPVEVSRVLLEISSSEQTLAHRAYWSGIRILR
jgi:hypothetical protein